MVVMNTGRMVATIMAMRHYEEDNKSKSSRFPRTFRTTASGCDNSLTQEIQERRKAEERMETMAFLGAVVIVSMIGLYGTLLYVPMKVRDATPRATKEILTAAHADATKTANALNLADYELVSPEAAQRDSARYARRINRFVKYHGEDYLVHHNPYPYDKQYYAISTNSLLKEPKLQKLVGKYKNTVQQLEMNRRHQRQKH